MICNGGEWLWHVCYTNGQINRRWIIVIDQPKYVVMANVDQAEEAQRHRLWSQIPLHNGAWSMKETASTTALRQIVIISLAHCYCRHGNFIRQYLYKEAGILKSTAHLRFVFVFLILNVIVETSVFVDFSFMMLQQAVMLSDFWWFCQINFNVYWTSCCRNIGSFVALLVELLHFPLVAESWLGRSVASVILWMCLSFCVPVHALKGKLLESTPNLIGSHIVHGKACINPEVKKSKVKGHRII